MIDIDKINLHDPVTFEDGDPTVNSNVIGGVVIEIRRDMHAINVQWDDGKKSHVRVASPALLSVGNQSRFAATA